MVKSRLFFIIFLKSLSPSYKTNKSSKKEYVLFYRICIKYRGFYINL